jgi:hypothetical protein
MDPINPVGTIARFTSPRHGYPLIHGNIYKSISSLAYVDDAKRFIAMPKTLHTCEEFFTVVQGYCDLFADLSLVIKMGRNVKKCTLYLYNIPHDTIIPTFTSTAWSYDAQGPAQGSITVVAMRRNSNEHLIRYNVLGKLKNDVPYHIKNILSPCKYLGISTNAQLFSWKRKTSQ